MAGGGERNWNHWNIDDEQEQHQDRSLNNASAAIHGDSSRDHHAGYDDFRTIYENGVGLVHAFGESLHHRPPPNQLILNPQDGGPFGLSLRKSTSLVKLIETTLTQESQQKIRPEDSCSQPSSKKLKASNFPAIFLEIGSWNWVSKNEGDLVAKLYYGKKKLVWEFLFGSLKRKMEISWDEISAINAFISKGENGRLEIELNVPPEFGQEINSQPGKHTQWTTMTDFTGDQALICRRQKVEFLPGVLDKHFEKLLQCDSRLLRLSQQPFPIHNSPYFPNTYVNFSNSGRVMGCSSIPVANSHHQEFFSQVGPLNQPTGPFVGHSSSNLPSASNMIRISRQNQKTHGVWDQSGNFQIQGTSSIHIREQDHFLPYHGTESIILHPQLELYINDAHNLVDFPIEQQAKGNYYDHTNSDNQLGYIDDEIALQEPSSWLPDKISIDDTNNNSSVLNHMGYVDDGVCSSVYQPGINNGVVMGHEPSSWLLAHVNSNYHDHQVHPLVPRMENFGTLDGKQNYKP
ncbi:hypothetical protein L6452_01602 [Arctium lappa]|uniref:Uncharacterized protein n=1 Tax=Arctium lappa TaxID=4217 RepID=A0ACB9FGK7_ARCLA|nr:hypothetical protein L6452_01602 [Arctium lappa]